MNYFLKKHKLVAWVILLTFLFTSVMPSNYVAGNSVAMAAETDETTPLDVNKTITANSDGSSTIALSVKGTNEKTEEIVGANVVIVFDTSNSMKNTATSEEVVTFTKANKGNYRLLSDGTYEQLLAQNGALLGNNKNTAYYRDEKGNIVNFTGDRYNKTTTTKSTTRMDEAVPAVKSVVERLLSLNGEQADGKTNPDDLVQIALVSFNGTATLSCGATTSKSTLDSALNALKNNSGTNWEAALQTAQNVNFGDEDPVTIIFVSDGQPSQSNATRAENPSQYYEGDEKVYTPAKTVAQSLVKGGASFYGLGIYGTVAMMERIVNDAYNDATKSAGKYYSVQNVEAFEEALSEIAKAIENSIGFNNVSVSDGVTGLSTVSADLSGEPKNFVYYKDGEEWADAPAATITEDNKVVWNPAGEDALDDGVTYMVTFDVWPSQDAYDLIADLNNGLKSYDALEDDIKAQIEKDGNNYSLKTNTDLKVSYTFGNEIVTDKAITPVPSGKMALPTQSITLKKEFVNDLGTNPDSVTLNLLVDGALYGATADNPTGYGFEMTKANNYQTTIYIAPGIMKNGAVMEAGHDYTIAENDYHWELNAGTYHPMIIDGVLTNLELDDVSGTIKIGDHKYAPAQTATITATNTRRSNLNIAKVVTGGSEEAFSFAITVTVPENVSEDDHTLWFSVQNGGETVTDLNVSDNVRDGGSGYYTVASGDAFTVDLKDGDNLRFTNLPTGSTYSVTEEAADNFRVDTITAEKKNNSIAKVDVTEAIDNDPAEATIDVDKANITGSVATPNMEYQVTYTNKSLLYTLTIEKTVVGLPADKMDAVGIFFEIKDEAGKVIATPCLGGAVGPEAVWKPVEDAEVETYVGTITATVQPGTYTVYEVSGYDVEGYDVVATGDASSPIEVTVENEDATARLRNVYSPTQYTLTVEKTVEGLTAKQLKNLGISVKIKNENGAVVHSTTMGGEVGEDKFWKPVKDAEVETYVGTITATVLPGTYTVTESDYDVTGYDVEADVSTEVTVDNADATASLVNIYSLITIDVAVEKVWEDDNDHDNVRPDSVKVSLYADDESLDEIEITADDQWTGSFTVPKYDADGDEIEYSVKELDKDGNPVEDGAAYNDNYTVSYSQNEDGTWVITNTHAPVYQYTINYILVGTDNGQMYKQPIKVADSISGKATAGSEITAELKDIQDCTIVDGQDRELTVGNVEADNVLNIYYYKNVEIAVGEYNKQYGDDDPDFTATVTGLLTKEQTGLDEDDELPYTLSRAEGENVGTYLITPAIDVPRVLANNDDSVAEANDIYFGYYKVTLSNGELLIHARNITLTSASDSKKYDGTPLTNHKITETGDGFVNGESVTCDVTGSQLDAGTSDNTFTYDLHLNEGSVTMNYNITTAFGTLTVTREAQAAYVVNYLYQNPENGEYELEDSRAMYLPNDVALSTDLLHEADKTPAKDLYVYAKAEVEAVEAETPIMLMADLDEDGVEEEAEQVGTINVYFDALYDVQYYYVNDSGEEMIMESGYVNLYGNPVSAPSVVSDVIFDGNWYTSADAATAKTGDSTWKFTDTVADAVKAGLVTNRVMKLYTAAQVKPLNDNTIRVSKAVTGTKAPAASTKYGFRLTLTNTAEPKELTPESAAKLNRLVSDKAAAEKALENAEKALDNAEKDVAGYLNVLNNSGYKIANGFAYTFVAYYDFGDDEENPGKWALWSITSGSSIGYELGEDMFKLPTKGTTSSAIAFVADEIEAMAAESDSPSGYEEFFETLLGRLNAKMKTSTTGSALSFDVDSSYGYYDALKAIPAKEAAVKAAGTAVEEAEAAIEAFQEEYQGVTVKVLVNGEEVTLKRDKNGNYIYNFTLTKDESKDLKVQATSGSAIRFVVEETNARGAESTTVNGAETTVVEGTMTTGQSYEFAFVNNFGDKPTPGPKPGPGPVPAPPEKDPEPTPKQPPVEEEIAPQDVPMAEPVEEVEIEEPEVPLGDAPQTGDAANAAGMMALLALAAAGLAITRRRFN